MFDPQELPELRAAIRKQAETDRSLLDELCKDIVALKPHVRTIKPRSATAVSLVASDGGNNKLAFDPFLLQVVRVVDSYGKHLFLDVISPTTDTNELSRRQFDSHGQPATALGRLMRDLGKTSLHALCPPIPAPGTDPLEVQPGWVLTYRDLCEWAVLYDRICYHDFATDTLIVRDGLLRTKIFHRDLFAQGMMKRIQQRIEDVYRQDRRRLFLVGVAKHTKLHTRYQLAMGLEDLFPPSEPRYVAVSRQLEEKNYKWDEYARGMSDVGEKGEIGKFVAGGMYFVRFGSQRGDPTWVVDIFEPQVAQAPEILGYLLMDSVEGFPVPLYPRCLQRAHEHAQVVDFDLDILQDTIVGAVRDMLQPDQRPTLDAIHLRNDVASLRYS